MLWLFLASAIGKKVYDHLENRSKKMNSSTPDSQKDDADPKVDKPNQLSTDAPKDQQEKTAKKSSEDDILPVDIAAEDGPSPKKGPEKKSAEDLSKEDQARLKRISELDATLSGYNNYDDISPLHTMVNFFMTLAAIAEKLYQIHKLDHPSNKNTDSNKQETSESLDDATPTIDVEAPSDKPTPSPEQLDDATPTIDVDDSTGAPTPDIELSDNPPVKDLDIEVSQEQRNLHGENQVNVISQNSASELTAKQENADLSNPQQKSGPKPMAAPEQDENLTHLKSPMPSPK